MPIETDFDVPLIASLALREKQIQQHYRPIVAVHKWFARRPGALFRGLLLAEFGAGPLADLFFQSNDLSGLKIADPFMGGGIPLVEANRLGCDVTGLDINPMATWIVQEEILRINLVAYERAAEKLVDALRSSIGDLYLTDCHLYGDAEVPVKYFLWVKVLDCDSCSRQIDLFPGYLLSEDSRHPNNILVCANCGELNEVEDRNNLGQCQTCGAVLTVRGPAHRNRCCCRHCGHVNTYPRGDVPLRHRMFAIEYYNPNRKATHKGRFFKKPDGDDLARVQKAQERWKHIRSRFVPTQKIPPGDETNRLLRWGYTRYREMFNSRQLLGLELSCRAISKVQDQRIRHALATNLSDLLRYQNMLCRYDTWALKSLDIFSVHGFPIGLIQCESNLLGITNGAGRNVGSGGWTNVIRKYVRAKRYCERPFEIKHDGTHKSVLPIDNESIGENVNGGDNRHVTIKCTSATDDALEPESFDAIFTDPPYFGNVQYGELMDFCYVWLRRLIGDQAEGFGNLSTRSLLDVSGNVTQARGLEEFTDGLSKIYQRVSSALKPGAPFVFTYHHNELTAYAAVGIALLDASLTCLASFPCPAEMAGSIHIHGTSSSILDTIFVCRSKGKMSPKWLFETVEQLLKIVNNDLDLLRQAGLEITIPDTHRVIIGHLTRMTVWNLRPRWKRSDPVKEKLARFTKALDSFGETAQIATQVASTASRCSSEDNRDAQLSRRDRQG